jgi:hypothetical protein
MQIYMKKRLKKKRIVNREEVVVDEKNKNLC